MTGWLMELVSRYSRVIQKEPGRFLFVHDTPGPECHNLFQRRLLESSDEPLDINDLTEACGRASLDRGLPDCIYFSRAGYCCA